MTNTARKASRKTPDSQTPEIVRENQDKALNRDFRRELTDLQQTVCELTGDLLVNGGHQRDLDLVLCAAARHSFRRTFEPFEEDSTDANMQGFAQRKVAQWKRSLVREWPADRVRKPDQSMPTAVSDIIRRNVRGQLEAQIEYFLVSAGMADTYLLRDILLAREMNANPTDNALADAFLSEIESETEYVRVPAKHADRVRQFVEMLADAGRSEPA